MKYLLLLVLTTIFTNCSPLATYPPVEINAIAALANSSYEPIPTVIVTTIEYASTHFGGIEETVYNLPEGVSSRTYEIVGSRIPDARPVKRKGEPAYYITELRVRGLRAQAEILFPRAGGGYETATLYLSKSFTGPWKVNRERIWLIPNETAPAPTYNPSKQVESTNLK